MIRVYYHDNQKFTYQSTAEYGMAEVKGGHGNRLEYSWVGFHKLFDFTSECIHSPAV